MIGALGMYAGVRIIECRHMTETVVDFSECRSPSRAKRRFKRGGDSKHIKYVSVPMRIVVSIDGGRTLTMHPEMARRLRELAMLPTKTDARVGGTR
jgi:hypothetical protein